MDRKGSRPRMAWRIENAAADRAEVWLYDQIGSDGWGGGIAAGDFAAELRAIGSKPVDVRINSGGGDVFDGLAIFNALKSHPGDVAVYIDGLAASAASFIAMAGGTIKIAKNASVMIHEASGMCWGPASDMLAMAQLLDDSSENIASIYADRAGGTTSGWRTAMKAETWYRGQAAVDAGLADEIAATPAKASARALRKILATGQVAPETRIAALHRPAATAGETAPLAAALASEVYEAITDCVEEWLEGGDLSIDESVAVTGLIGPVLSTLTAGLTKLGLADRVVEADPGDDDGMEMRSSLRIVAQTDEPAQPGEPIAIGAKWSTEASYTPPPTLEELLAKQIATGSLLAGAKSGGS